MVCRWLRSMLWFLLLLIPINSKADNVTLAWDASPDPVTGYDVYWGTASVLTNASSSVSIGSTLQHTIKGLTAGMTYFFAVKARYYNNVSGFSNEVSYVMPVGGAPAVPSGFYFSAG